MPKQRRQFLEVQSLPLNPQHLISNSEIGTLFSWMNLKRFKIKSWFTCLGMAKLFRFIGRSSTVGELSIDVSGILFEDYPMPEDVLRITRYDSV